MASGAAAAGSASRLDRHLHHLTYWRRLQRPAGGGAYGCGQASGLPMLHQCIQSCLLQGNFRLAGRVIVGALRIYLLYFRSLSLIVFSDIPRRSSCPACERNSVGLMIFLCKVQAVLVWMDLGVGHGVAPRETCNLLLTGFVAATGFWHAAATRRRPPRCPVCPYCFVPRSRHSFRAHVAAPSPHPQCGLHPRPSPRPNRLRAEIERAEAICK